MTSWSLAVVNLFQRVGNIKQHCLFCPSTLNSINEFSLTYSSEYTSIACAYKHIFLALVLQSGASYKKVKQSLMLHSNNAFNDFTRKDAGNDFVIASGDGSLSLAAKGADGGCSARSQILMLV